VARPASDASGTAGSGGDNDSLTAVAGLRVGHWTDARARTGCTVVVCPPEGCTVSGLVLGPAPASHEAALLDPERTVAVAHAVLITGGSAFGLAASAGVVGWLEEQGRGVVTPFARVPIVPAAALYDLGVGDAGVRPGPVEGRAAAAAASARPVAQGRVGAGAGATVGLFAGFEHHEASGLGSAALRVAGATVAALGVSNAEGNLVDPNDGSVVAGVRGIAPDRIVEAYRGDVGGGNTTLVVVGTDAPLTKAEARALAQSAHIGIARVTRPSHTLRDGDTTFVLSTGAAPAVSPAKLAVAVQEVVARALLNGARAARGG